MNPAVRALAFGVVLSATPGLQAATLVEQTLDDTSTYSGFCSPCWLDPNNLGRRAFAYFEVDERVAVSGGTFAVLDYLLDTRVNGAFQPVWDIDISIWGDPSADAAPLFSESFGDYTRSSNGARHWATVELSSQWILEPGGYWISLFGVNGNKTGWGKAGFEGDDGVFLADGTREPSRPHYGFSLEGQAAPSEVPLPGTFGLLGVGLALTGLLRRSRPARPASA
jgi:hypothetical protein